MLACDDLKVKRHSYIASYDFAYIQVTAEAASSEDDEFLPECNVTKGKTSNVQLSNSGGLSTPISLVSTPTDPFSTRRVPTHPAPSTVHQSYSIRRVPTPPAPFTDRQSYKSV